MERRLLPLLLLIASASYACGASEHALEISFESGVDPETVRYVELLVLPSCPDESVVTAGDPPTDQATARLGLARVESTALPRLESLAPGRYGFYARGFDQTCHAVVSTCVPVRVGDDDGTVRLELATTTATTVACGPTAICRDGRCDEPDGGGPGDGNCGVGQYELTPPTGSAPRVCGTCVTCSATQYETVPCANSNSPQARQCSFLTQCTTGQYASVPATATSNRVCSDCRVCEVGQTVDVECANGNGANDRVCSGGMAVCTLVATRDGQSSPASSNGATTMRTTNTGVDEMVAFVGFDLTATCAEGGTIPAGATVVAATMTLTMVDACVCGATSHELRPATSAWTEASALSTSSPSVRESGSATATFSAPGSGASVAISGPDLVTELQGFLEFPTTNHGYRIRQPGTGGNSASPWRWATRENANVAARPTLSITYERP